MGHPQFPVDLYSTSPLDLPVVAVSLGSRTTGFLLAAYVDVSGTDRSAWHLKTLVYNKQIFHSTADFVNAWKSGTLIRSEKPSKGDEGWAERTRKGNKRDLDHLAGPRSVNFDGPRFRVDEEQKWVSWMGWSMFLGFERDMVRPVPVHLSIWLAVLT